MQFTRLRLQDYGVYGGTTDIDLRPEPDRPVILFGGTNGAGKTTLFESILVCLYGQGCMRMMRSGQGGGGRREYERLLAGRLHRSGGGRTAGSASIMVGFAAFAGGRGTEYEVCRSWRAARGARADARVRESLSVGRRPAGSDAAFEPVDMESRWQSFIMDLAPPAVAGLFFFDGEHISRIARQYGGYAGDAFRAALGLDIVDKLQADLLANGAREEKDGAGTGGRGRGGSGGAAKKQYIDLEAERAKHDAERQRLSELLDLKAAALAELRSELAAAEQRVAAFQGDEGDSTRNAAAEPATPLDRAVRDAEETESRILSACASCEAPFRLLPPDMLLTLTKWVDAHWDAQVRGFAAGAADEFVEALRKYVMSDDSLDDAGRRGVLGAIDAVAESRKAKRAKASDPEPPMPGTASAVRALRTLKAAAEPQGGAGLPALCSLLAAQRTRAGELESARDITERGTSERMEVVRVVSDLASRAGAAAAEVRVLESRMREHAAAARAANSGMRDLLRRAQKRGGSARKSELRASALDALGSFSARMLSSRTRRLEDALLQNLRVLMHKNAVERVEVDAENSFAIRLYGPAAGADAEGGDDGASGDGANPLQTTDPASGLSEGERQMFALSVVWALAKTSGRPLPFVIDTPLARLDAAHRAGMVREFLPGCSHQVLVLSTDSEVDESAYGEIEPRVAKSYTLEYDKAEGRAACRPGFFLWGRRGREVRGE